MRVAFRCMNWGKACCHFQEAVQPRIAGRVAGLTVADDDRRTIKSGLQCGRVSKEFFTLKLAFLVTIVKCLTLVELFLQYLTGATTAHKCSGDMMPLGQAGAQTRMEQSLQAMHVGLPGLTSGRLSE